MTIFIKFYDWKIRLCCIATVQKCNLYIGSSYCIAIIVLGITYFSQKTKKTVLL